MAAELGESSVHYSILLSHDRTHKITSMGDISISSEGLCFPPEPNQQLGNYAPANLLKAE